MTESTSTANTTMEYELEEDVADVADIESTATRRCSRCHEQLTLDCFHRGHGGYCKECRKTYYKMHIIKRKRSDAPESESDSDGEGDPCDPSAAHVLDPTAIDLYMFANSMIPDIIKIGRSKDVERRRLELQKSQPFRIIILATFPGKGGLEGAVHAALSASRVDGPGREWFKVSASDAMHAIAIAMR
jgi:hypothetical protein